MLGYYLGGCNDFRHCVAVTTSYDGPQAEHALCRVTSGLIEVDMVRLLPENVLELRMQRPATWMYRQQAGQYAYVMVPEVNPMPSCALPL